METKTPRRVNHLCASIFNNPSFYNVTEIILVWPTMALALLGTLVVVYLVCKLLIETSRLSPLRRIPNAHPTSSFSSLWINYMRWSKCENRAIHAAFRRHGSIVRLAPHEIAVNSIERGVHTVYGGGFEKHEWYSNLFDNYEYASLLRLRLIS